MIRSCTATRGPGHHKDGSLGARNSQFTITMAFTVVRFTIRREFVRFLDTNGGGKTFPFEVNSIKMILFESFNIKAKWFAFSTAVS